MSKITIVSGVNHHMEAFEGVRNGMKVRFVHDEENRFSENAVWVVVDGIGVIGHVTEGYIPSGFRAYGEDAIRSPDILNGIIRKNLEYEAIIQDKKPNGCLVLFKTTSEDIVEEMEEDTMDKWEIGTTEEEFTLVGCGHFVTDKRVGDKVSIGVENYAIDDNDKIKGTACAFNEMGEVIGLFPQSERKFADCEAMGGKYVSGTEIKGKYASDLLERNGYVIIDISKDGRFIKIGLEQSEPVVEENEPQEKVVQPETTSEPIVEEMEEPQMNLDKELHELNLSIRALKAQKEAIEAKMEELMAKREELAAINAKRITLIEEISKGLETLDLSVLESMKDCMSSSTTEEDIPSSIEEENFVIDFKDHYEERISRFEQSDIQKKNNTCDIILYYASNTWGSERTIKDVKLSDNVVEYLKSVIPHNQCMGEHVIELEMALEAII